MSGMIQIFKNRNFSLLFWASFTSMMGSTIGLAAFTYYILNRFSNQPVYATVTELMYSLPVLCVFFIVGVLADMMDRKKIATNCELFCGILSLGLFMAVKGDWLPIIFAFLFLRSAVSKFFEPAKGGLMQGILDKDSYAVASGLGQVVGSVLLLFGNTIGIFMYWEFGVEGAIMVDAISYFLSALLIWMCSINVETCLPNGSHTWKDIDVKRVFSDFKEGISYMLGNKLLLALTGGFLIFGIMNGSFSVILIFLLKYQIAPTSYETVMMWAGIVFGSGILIGSIAGSALVKKLKLYEMIILGLVVSGIFIFITGFITSVYGFLVCCFMAALAIPFVNIGVGGWLPSVVDSKIMGRVSGLISPLMMLTHSLTLGIIAFVYPKFASITTLYVGLSICVLGGAIFYAFTLPKYAAQQKEETSVVVEA